MDGYIDYQEFLHDLKVWGDINTGRREDENWGEHHTAEALSQMLYKARRGADDSVFSPFLYLVLAAELSRYETLFLAAVLYNGSAVPGSGLTYADWKKFWQQGTQSFPGAELFYQAHPLIYKRKLDENYVEVVSLRFPVFLFLSCFPTGIL